MKATTLVGLAVFVCLSGCDDPPKTEPAKPGATAPAPAPAKGCAAGHTEVKEHAFCVKLPAGYKVGETQPGDEQSKRVELGPEQGSGRISVKVTTAPWDEAKDTYERYTDESKNVVKDKGEFLGGKGKWFYSTPKNSKGATAGVYVQGPKLVYVCELAGSDDGPEYKQMIDVCKTIVPLGA